MNEQNVAKGQGNNCQECRMWANQFLGLHIPLPGEVTV